MISLFFKDTATTEIYTSGHPLSLHVALPISSADRLNAGWHAAERVRQAGEKSATAHIERLLAPLADDAALVTITDRHPLALEWLGSVRGHREIGRAHV